MISFAFGGALTIKVIVIKIEMGDPNVNLFAFHFTLMLLRKALIHPVLPLLWVSGRSDCVFSHGLATGLVEE